MRNPEAYLLEKCKDDDYDADHNELLPIMSTKNVLQYMIDFALECIAEDRDKIEAYLKVYPEANPKHCPTIKFV